MVSQDDRSVAFNYTFHSTVHYTEWGLHIMFLVE